MAQRRAITPGCVAERPYVCPFQEEQTAGRESCCGDDVASFAGEGAGDGGCTPRCPCVPSFGGDNQAGLICDCYGASLPRGRWEGSVLGLQG
jgi:hypothetical protein